MIFADLLRNAGIDPEQVKLLRHCPDGVIDPYAAWRARPADFETYQTIQKIGRRSYFNRPIWASFAPDRRGRTFFIGLFDVSLHGVLEADVMEALTGKTEHAGVVDRYHCSPRSELCEYVGRLVVEWGPGTRTWVQNGASPKPVAELLKEIEDPIFPGYLEVIQPLSAIATLPNRWIDFLREGRGVYLLTCPRTREQYVGKADGVDGFWGRWVAYATTGDGGNVRLKSREKSDYQVSILEVAGSAASPDDILGMEERWKAKLQTREMGLNGN